MHVRVIVCMCGRMYGWLDGPMLWIDDRMHKRVNVRMDGRMYGWLDGPMLCIDSCVDMMYRGWMYR